MTTLTLLLTLLSGAALAADAPTEAELAEARALYDQGVRSYDRGEYETAIRLWRKSHAITGFSELLHNIAKAWEEANRPRDALTAWREYLEVAPEAEQANAKRRIADLEVVVAALADPEPEPEPEPKPVVVAPAPAPVRDEPKRGYRGLAIAGLSLAGVGAVTGGSWLSASARSSATDAAVNGCVSFGGSVLCDAGTDATLRGDRLQFGLGVGVIGGGVALGAGAVALAVTPRKDRAGVTLNVGPNGLLVTGRY